MPEARDISAAKPRVFVSYSAPDGPIAERLTRDLADAGIEVDTIRDLAPGENIAAAVIERIQAADTVLILLSPASGESEWVQVETSLALAQALHNPSARVIPVLVSRAVEVPSLLRGIAWIDLTESATYRRQLDLLINAVKTQGSADALASPRAVKKVANALALREAILAYEREAYESARIRTLRLWINVLAYFLAVATAATTIVSVFVAGPSWKRTLALAVPLFLLLGYAFRGAGGLESESKEDKL